MLNSWCFKLLWFEDFCPFLLYIFGDWILLCFWLEPDGYIGQSILLAPCWHNTAMSVDVSQPVQYRNCRTRTKSHLFLQNVWENSIIMKYCGAAAILWPNNLVLQMKESMYVWLKSNKYHIVTILKVFCKNENCYAKMTIPTDRSAGRNRNFSQNKCNLTFFLPYRAALIFM